MPMDHEHPGTVGGGVNQRTQTWDAAEQVFNQALLRGTPMPRRSAVPSVDYIADEIEGLCNMMSQEVEQRTCFARSRTEVHIGDPDRSVVTALKHGLPSSIVSRTDCDTTIQLPPASNDPP